jgi:hypothetical protein
LFRIRTDGTEEAILDEQANDFFVVGDWIYFSNGLVRSGLYKMRTDGTEKNRLVDDDFANERAVHNITVIGDWIYYRRSDGHIFRTRTDGTGQTELKHWELGRQIEQFVIIDDWVYYSATSLSLSDGEAGIYKMRVDGTGETKISNCIATYLNTDGEWLYFYEQWRDTGVDWLIIYGYAEDEEKYGRLHRLALDGAEDTIISDNEIFSYNPNIIDDWIYFKVADFSINETGEVGLYRMRTDGMGRQKVE